FVVASRDGDPSRVLAPFLRLRRHMPIRSTRRRTRRGLIFLALSLAVPATVAIAAAATPSSPPRARSAGAPAKPASYPGMEAFDWAFRFASAIHSDPKDMARAQENIVDDLAEAGHLDEAIRRAELIEGWRRGAAFADLASRLAEAGRAEDARRILARAEGV